MHKFYWHFVEISLFLQKLICYSWGDRTGFTQDRKSTIAYVLQNFCLSTLSIGMFTQEHSIEGTGITYSPGDKDSFLFGLNQGRWYDCGGWRGFLALGIVRTEKSLDLIILSYYHHYPNKEDTKTHLTKDLLINLQISWHWFICGLYLDSRWFCFWLYFCWRGKTKVGRLYVF